MTEVRRENSNATSPKNQTTEDIALALMGVGELPGDMIAENAVWDSANGAVTGRNAIRAAQAALPAADLIEVKEVVTHGKAGAVSGRVTRKGGRPRLFCHVIRYTSAAGHQIAQLVTIEHAGGKHG
ncbi:hypothetical protein ACXYMO_06485 [Arenibacterium sp. CAU 1754]